MKLNLDANYWNNRYLANSFGWDIGYPSPAITKYFDSIDNKDAYILIPGCGSAYEGEYLINSGFTNVFLLDAAEESKNRFLKRVPEYKHFEIGNFFNLRGRFDFIIEQTFFCAINPILREEYALKMKELLKPNGKLVGLMFNAKLNADQPPFGGDKLSYERLFKKYFNTVRIKETNQSIIPRLGKEVFIEISNL